MFTLPIFLWKVGKFSLNIGFLATSGATFYWIFREKTGRIYQMDSWPDKVNNNIMTTYFYLMASYILMIASMSFSFNNWYFFNTIKCFPFHFIVGSIFVMIILLSLVETLPYTPGEQPVKIFCWLMHSITMGPTFSFIGNSVCIQALLYTMCGISLAILFGYAAPIQLYMDMRYVLSLMYFIVAATSGFMVALGLGQECMHTFNVIIMEISFIGGIFLYFFVAVTNTQSLVDDALNAKNFDPIFLSSIMFMCTLNFYLRIALFLTVESTDIIGLSLSREPLKNVL